MLFSQFGQSAGVKDGNALVELIQSAAELTLKYYQQGDFAVNYKADASPVTSADIASSKLICSELKRLSNLNVLSEEAVVSFEERSKWSKFWLVDPLDGTKDFIDKTGDFTVNIALVEECAPILGMIAIPAQNKFYLAEKNWGVYRMDDDKVTKIGVSHEKRLWRCAVSRVNCSKATLEFCKLNNIVETRSYGSALKMCKIADGEIDIYPRLAPTMEWDTAAGQCIMEEAGGEILSADSLTPLVYNKEDLHNPSFIAVRKDLKFKI